MPALLTELGRRRTDQVADNSANVASSVKTSGFSMASIMIKTLNIIKITIITINWLILGRQELHNTPVAGGRCNTFLNESMNE